MSSGKLKTFFSKQGFYLLMIGCVGVIGIAALVGGLSNREAEVELKATATPAATSQPVSNQDPVILPSATPAQSNQVKAVELIQPVAGEIIRPYAMDSLVYSATLKHWQTHSGVDIKAEEGAGVMAARDGKVVSVTQDALMGTVITIAHEDGAQSVYASLKSASVKAEDQVTAGQTIGAVGTTASSELEDGAHLHFEYRVGDKAVDPTDYFQGK